jgi:diguanylate cyclase (GGDEF)-like protein
VPAAAVAIIVLALLFGNVILIGALLPRRRTASVVQDDALTVAGEPVDLALELAPDSDGGSASGSGIRLATYDRVVRIVSYAFILVTAIVVAAGGLWPDSAPAIYLLLLVGAGTVFVLHEMAPEVTDVGTFFLTEGAAAVTFFTLLIMLTGGVASPFFFGYFLIVAAAALVTGGSASLVLAAAITASFLGALLVTRGGQPYTTEQIVIVASDVMALWLLSYLASAVAGEQRRTRDAALRLSLHDPLTRLYNRTFLFAVIEREIARAGRTNRRFSLLMLDLDGLKPINDRFGHYFGDRMLQAVAVAIRQHIRLIDTAARYGGDEFVVLLPETDTDGAAVVAEKLRRSVAAIRLDAGTDLLRSTASIGVVAFPEDGRTADALTNRADQVMYAAKRAGRDRVSVEGRMEPAPVMHVRPTGSSSRSLALGGAPATVHAVRPATSATVAVHVARQTTGSAATLSAAGSSSASSSRAGTRTATKGDPRGIEDQPGTVEPRPSMFGSRVPILPVSSGPRAASWERSVDHGQRGPVAAGSTATTARARPLSTVRPPTTRAKRFHVEPQHDRTFERTMRHFLRGGDSLPAMPPSATPDPGA